MQRELGTHATHDGPPQMVSVSATRQFIQHMPTYLNNLSRYMVR